MIVNIECFKPQEFNSTNCNALYLQAISDQDSKTIANQTPQNQMAFKPPMTHISSQEDQIILTTPSPYKQMDPQLK